MYSSKDSEEFWLSVANKCLDCEYFDGYDLCLHSKQPHNTIYYNSLEACPLNNYPNIDAK